MGNKSSRMNGRQRAFADYYIELGNATEAARRAGYKQPKQQGSRLLTNVDLLAYIKQRTAPIEAKRIASGDEVLQFFTRVLEGLEKDAFGLDASLDVKIKAGKEILKRDIDSKKLEIELLKLESRINETAQESEIEDTFLEALNSTAVEVWGSGDSGSMPDG